MAESTYLAEEISRSRLPNTDYVCIIADVWQGDRTDPAVGVNRYMALFPADRAPEELQFSSRSYSLYLSSEQRDAAVLWEYMSVTKEENHSASQMQNDTAALMGENRYSYGSAGVKKDLFQAFMKAVDILAEDEANAEAWSDVEAWRSYLAHAYEK